MALLTLDQMTAPQNLSIAIVGPPKTGKTESLATFWSVFEKTKQPNNKIVVFDLDEDGSVPVIRRGLDHQMKDKDWSIEDHLAVHRFKRKAGEKLSTETSPNRWQDECADFMTEFNKYYDLVNSVTGDWKAPEHAPGLVAVDSMTALQDLFWNFILSKRNKEIGVGRGDGSSKGPVTFDEWNLLRGKLVETIRAAKGLPCHSVFVFHQDLRQEEVKGALGKPDSDILTGAYFYVQMIVSQLAMSVLKEFSVVLTTMVQGGKYKWQVIPDDRHPSLGSRAVAGFKDRLIDQDFSLVVG